MWIRPSIIRLIPAAFVGLSWFGTTILAYIRGSKILQKKEEPRPDHTPLSREEILIRASEIEKEKEYRAKCLKARLCPDCGCELEIDSWREFDDGTCKVCNKTYPL